MVTDDERREVARRLRGNPEDTLIPHRTGRHHGMGCHEAADRFWDMCDRIKAAGDYDIAFSTTSVLADLIEPAPERTYHPERIGTAYHSTLMCSACKYPLDDVTIYCPHCGARLEGIGR